MEDCGIGVLGELIEVQKNRPVAAVATRYGKSFIYIKKGKGPRIIRTMLIIITISK